jgi:hypothetical protein
MNRLATASFLVLGTLTSAAAQTPPPVGTAYAPATPRGYHEHDGFYFRGILGLNATVMTSSDPEVEVAGAGGTFGLAVGWAVARNLILYAEIFDDIAVNPTVTIGDVSAETSNTSAGVIAFGAGIAYYFMPVNLYVSATFAASQLTVHENDMEIGNSELGFGVSLMVGKEWWVSANWGLGVALQLYGGTMKDQGERAPTWSTGAAALVSSATYN